MKVIASASAALEGREATAPAIAVICRLDVRSKLGGRRFGRILSELRFVEADYAAPVGSVLAP